MRKFIVSCAGLLAITTAVILEYYFADYKKNYVTMALTAAFFIYWGIEFVLVFVNSKKTYPERFKLFAAEIVNKNHLSMDIINANKKLYMKKFKRSIFKERLTYFLEIFFSFGAGVALIVAMFF